MRRTIKTWRKRHPDILGYAFWRVARFLLDEGLDEAAYSAIEQGIGLGLNTTDPHLAKLACERLVETGNSAAALQLTRDATVTAPLTIWVRYAAREND